MTCMSKEWLTARVYEQEQEITRLRQQRSALTQERDDWRGRYDAEYPIVDRVWTALRRGAGSPHEDIAAIVADYVARAASAEHRLQQATRAAFEAGWQARDHRSSGDSSRASRLQDLWTYQQLRHQQPSSLRPDHGEGS